MVSMLCDAADSLLVLIDLQPGLAEAMPVKEWERTRHNCLTLLTAAQVLSVPVLLTEQHPPNLGATFPEISTRLPPGTRPLSKASFSCIGAEGFTARLQQSGRTQVILAGQEAHVSVLQTAIALLALGFSVFVVEDAVVSRHPEHKLYALERMRQAGAVVLPGESVLFEWLGSAHHPRFKELVSLL